MDYCKMPCRRVLPKKSLEAPGSLAPRVLKYTAAGPVRVCTDANSAHLNCHSIEYPAKKHCSCMSARSCEILSTIFG